MNVSNEKNLSLLRTISNLDETLLRLSDNPSGRPPPDSAPSAEASLIRTYAPKNLESPFQELYSILYPCLRPRIFEEEEPSTASAILMGPRGSGKSLLLERCLAACQDQARKQYKKPAQFQKVVVHGIVVRGEDVPSVVYEIMRQLSDLAMKNTSMPCVEEEPSNEEQSGDQNDCATDAMQSKSTNKEYVGDAPRKRVRQQRQGRHNRSSDEYLLRMRRSTFTSNLALLESALKMAEVDRIPILLILDEFDTFLMDQKGERQLLLYHLLDRVATPGSNLILVGLTSSFTALTQMEKRIRSRAEGTSKIVFVRPPTTYDEAVTILKDKLKGCCVQEDLLKYFSKAESQSNVNSQDWKISNALKRSFRTGKDIRWYNRVLSTALSLYRFDCVLNTTPLAGSPKFLPKYLMEALAMMGASSISDAPTITTTKQANLCLVQGAALDPRLQALLDMPKPQVALVLAARRILAREAHNEQAMIQAPPLTLQRMLQEYNSFLRRGMQKYDHALLTEAAMKLLDRGILVPSLDHSGGGPLQYHVSLSFQNMDPYSLSRLPLHLPVEMERELEEALKQNLLDCSTALKEWGRKTN